MKIVFSSFFIFLVGCSGMEESQKQSVRKQNCKAEYILRKSTDHEYVFQNPKIKPKPVYPFHKKEESKKSMTK